MWRGFIAILGKNFSSSPSSLPRAWHPPPLYPLEQWRLFSFRIFLYLIYRIFKIRHFEKRMYNITITTLSERFCLHAFNPSVHFVTFTKKLKATCSLHERFNSVNIWSDFRVLSNKSRLFAALIERFK